MRAQYAQNQKFLDTNLAFWSGGAVIYKLMFSFVLSAIEATQKLEMSISELTNVIREAYFIILHIVRAKSKKKDVFLCFSSDFENIYSQNPSTSVWESTLKR